MVKNCLEKIFIKVKNIYILNMSTTQVTITPRTDNSGNHPESEQTPQQSPKKEYTPKTPDQIIKGQLRDINENVIPKIGLNTGTQKRYPISEINVLSNNASNEQSIYNFLAAVLKESGKYKKDISNGNIYYIKKNKIFINWN